MKWSVNQKLSTALIGVVRNRSATKENMKTTSYRIEHMGCGPAPKNRTEFNKTMDHFGLRKVSFFGIVNNCEQKGVVNA